MDNKYLKTKQGTDFKPKTSIDKLLTLLLFFIPKTNPSYENQLHHIAEWLIEFDDKGLPSREIGLNEFGEPVLAGPTNTDYGFWLDTNMKYSDFEGTTIFQSEFEQLWQQAFNLSKD